MKFENEIRISIDVDREIYDAMGRSGLLTPSELIRDGEIHRFHANGSKSQDNDSGWYVLYDGDFVSGAFGDWSRDIAVTFHSSNIETLTPSEREAHRLMVEQAQQQARAQRAKLHEETSHSASKIWEALPPCPPDHPYLVKKGLKSAYGARLQGSELVIPVMDMEGKIWSLQNITAEGEKRYMSNGKMDGNFWVVGHGEPAFMCEGLATAASVHEATGLPVVVAYNAHNLVPVAQHFPKAVIVADNDESGTGEKWALKSGNPFKVIPVKGMDANDYATSGHDLKAFLMPRSSYVLKSLKDTLAKVEPPQWLIKGWIPKGNYFGMNFGPSGNGKTFVIIDMMMCITTGQSWHGRKVQKGNVLYLCGEGNDSVKDRLQVWLQENGIEPGTWPYISEGATDIDTPDGFDQLTGAVEALGEKPDLVIIDTLNRFMKGDENKTQDATALIQACKRVQDMYQCCVMLVHHTGLSEDAQNRSRGSSAFKGALDFQLMTEKSGDIFTVTQTKVKRGKAQEPIRLMLEDHGIGFDEDGNEVCSAILVTPTDEPVRRKPDKQVEDEDILTRIFVSFGYMFMGRPCISYQKMKEAILELKEDTKDPEESARKAMNIRRMPSQKPTLFERLVSYGDLEVVSESNGLVRCYYANGYEVNGVTEPFFSMAIEGKAKAMAETAET